MHFIAYTCGQQIYEDIASTESEIDGYISRMVRKIKESLESASRSARGDFGGGDYDGSHRNGLDYVPFDDYRAILHKGEAVLTANENKKYNSTQTVVKQTPNVTVNQYISAPTADARSFKDDDLTNDIITTKTNMQDGETIAGHALSTRGITIEGHYRLESKNNTIERRLKHICNPKLKGVLVFRDIDVERHIEVMPEEMLDTKRDLRSTRYSINLLAHDPFWREAEKTEEISLLEPMLSFPLAIPPGGFIFGRKRAALETVVNNIGDVASGFRVVFVAKGTVENPSIRNAITGDQIKILYTMEREDVIEVINEPSVKQVLINGEKAFKYLDRRNSNFFQLEVGKNIIGYQADTNEAIDMARDAIGIWGISEQDVGREIPNASTFTVPHEEDEILTLVDIDFAEYRRKSDNKTVRKNLTIPNWLNVEAEKAGVNFSRVLQDALIQELELIK